MEMQGRDRRCPKLKTASAHWETVQVFGDNGTFSDSFPFAGIILFRLLRVSVGFLRILSRKEQHP